MLCSSQILIALWNSLVTISHVCSILARVACVCVCVCVIYNDFQAISRINHYEKRMKILFKELYQGFVFYTTLFSLYIYLSLFLSLSLSLSVFLLLPSYSFSSSSPFCLLPPPPPPSSLFLSLLPVNYFSFPLHFSLVLIIIRTGVIV